MMAARLKILQIAPQLPYPAVDGGKIGIFNITKYLALRGHKIYFLTFTSDTSHNFDGMAKYCEIIQVQKDTSNKTLGLLANIFSKLPYNLSKYKDRRILNKIYEILAEKNIDIIHIDHLHMAYYGKHIMEKFNIPIVLREHNIETVIMERFYREQKNIFTKLYAYLQFKKLYKFESKIVDIFDKCLMITPVDQRKIKQMNYNVRTAVIPAGVDSSFFHPIDKEEEPFTIISVCNLVWLPNIEGIIWFCEKVFPLILRDISNIKFYIVGKNPPDEIRKYKSQNAIVTGYIDDVRELIAKCQAYIVPLNIGSGIRLRILNALSMGKAVISTSIGAEGIDVTDGKNILIADDPINFATNIINVIKDCELRQKIGMNGIELIQQKYTWEKIAENIEKEYREMIMNQNQ